MSLRVLEIAEIKASYSAPAPASTLYQENLILRQSFLSASKKCVATRSVIDKGLGLSQQVFGKEIPKRVTLPPACKLLIFDEVTRILGNRLAQES